MHGNGVKHKEWRTRKISLGRDILKRERFHSIGACVISPTSKAIKQTNFVMFVTDYPGPNVSIIVEYLVFRSCMLLILPLLRVIIR